MQYFKCWDDIHGNVPIKTFYRALVKNTLSLKSMGVDVVGMPVIPATQETKAGGF
jgi:hypothetical protein